MSVTWPSDGWTTKNVCPQVENARVVAVITANALTVAANGTAARPGEVPGSADDYTGTAIGANTFA